MVVVSQQISRIVVLGGGTAGWMAACYLGKALHGTVQVTVIAAPDIPTLGVGEATIPNLQTAFFDFLGIPEDEWMAECNASYKMAVKFINWRTPGRGQSVPRSLGSGTDHFYHLFGLLPTIDGLPLSHYWVNRRLAGETDEPFDYACYAEAPALDDNRAPRWTNGSRSAPYAWHFDAHLVAAYLRKLAMARFAVRHVEDRVVDITRHADGRIRSLVTNTGAELEADLFVDCSGFRGVLINQVLEEPFIDMNDHLLCNSAVAASIAHDDEALGVEPYTSAIAMPAGWTWKIPMLGRYGTGYVYSREFASEDEATLDFCRLWNLDPNTTQLNKIHFRVGRNRNAWVKNCVSIGAASCFVEPLESTGIYFIYAALYQLVKHFPDRSFNPHLVNGFNREIAKMFDDTRDFIQAHYFFSPRGDTPFWRANKGLCLGETMAEKVDMYRAGLAVNQSTLDDVNVYHANFDEEFRNFWQNSNYYCILAGLGLLPDSPIPLLKHRPSSIEGAETVFRSLKQKRDELLKTLPACSDYLAAQHGRRDPLADALAR